MQLRLGVDPERVVPEVWGALGALDRAVVIERLAEAMAKAAVAAATGEGGDSSREEEIEGGEQGCGDITRIA